MTDSRTGLVWQQGEVALPLAWEAALTQCESLFLGGGDDWRLPNVKELRSVSDNTLVRPSVDTTYFPAAQAAAYWSSTSLAGRAGSAWFVDFATGLASYSDKAGALRVRCIRNAP